MDITTESEFRQLLSSLDKANAVIVVRLETHDDQIDEIKENQKWQIRFLVSTLVMGLLSVVTAVFSVMLSL